MLDEPFLGLDPDSILETSERFVDFVKSKFGTLLIALPIQLGAEGLHQAVPVRHK